ncbi:hypothetical protein P7C73_g1642, partial [Tremellales sp. Uapishka_1]
MGLYDYFGNSSVQRDQVYNMDIENQQHQASLSHEVIGGAAGYEAMKAYEQHCAMNGRPASVGILPFRIFSDLAGSPQHAQAKEIIAGLAAAEVDRLFETKGLNMYDREMAKRHASDQAVQAFECSGEAEQQFGGQQYGGQQYGGQQQFNEQEQFRSESYGRY